MNRNRMKNRMVRQGQDYMTQRQAMARMGLTPPQHQDESVHHPHGPKGNLKVDIADDVAPPPPPVGAGKGFKGI